jgi:hypothetical protein
VRDAERLVQVEVADVGAEATRSGQPEQRVEVGPVDVDLPPGIVHQRTHVGHGRLVHPVRGRIGDHDGSQFSTVLGDLLAEVVEVDVAIAVTSDDHDAHPGHHRRRSVGAVRAGRDQADVAAGLATAAVIGADRQQTGELSLAAGVGLQADRVVTGELGQPLLQVVDHFE